MKRIILPFFVFLSMIIPQDAFSTKMGVELELQEITYVSPPTVTFMDHIRLFESDKKDENDERRRPNWYLEVDGSGNIEFVSRPIDVNTEKDIIELSCQEMNRLMHFILANSVLDENENVYYFNQILAEDRVIPGLGTFVHWKPRIDGSHEEIVNNIQIKISDPLCVVRPQATFQVPLIKVQDFAHYMATSHRSLSKAIKTINSLQFFLWQHKPIEIKNHGQGLAYLVMLTSELLRNEYSKGELGPKGILTLMSRSSFSKMYENLEEGDKQKYQELITVYENQYNSEKLFKQPYALFYPEDIAKNREDEIGKLIDQITVGQFLDSISNPNQYQDLFERSKDLLKAALEQKQLLGAQDFLTEELQNIKSGYFNFLATDLLSPPPFLKQNYSLGKIKDTAPEMAILEMRGYTAQYRNNMKMGPLVELWLFRERKNAEKLWGQDSLPLDFYQKESKPIEKKYQELPSIIKQSSIYEIEAWMNLAITKKIQEKINDFSQEDYAQLFVQQFNDFKDNFLQAKEQCEPDLQKQILEEKRQYVLELLSN